jgi:hypothetical protein
VRVALIDREAIFRAQEANKRMSDKAALACRAVCRNSGGQEGKRFGNGERDNRDHSLRRSRRPATPRKIGVGARWRYRLTHSD